MIKISSGLKDLGRCFDYIWLYKESLEGEIATTGLKKWYAPLPCFFNSMLCAHFQFINSKIREANNGAQGKLKAL